MPAKPFRVLSLDGGGMRGLYTASVLNQLSQLFIKQRTDNTSHLEHLDIGKAFDLIVGTSTGGILACALGFGINIEEIMNLYRLEGPNIFTNPIPDYKTGKVKFIFWLIHNLTKPFNNNEHLRKILHDWFQDKTLGYLYEKRGIALCIPAVKLIDEKARVFKTPHNRQKKLDTDQKIMDICLATSAAPIYLPLASLKAPHDPDTIEVFADGGLWANNPVLIGLIEALDLAQPDQPIEILSIGTCGVPEGSVLETSELNRGILNWQMGTKALSLSMNAQSSGNTYMVELFEQILIKYGKKITVFRIPASAPSTDQTQYMRLDSASKKALQLLASLGANDGLNAYRFIHKKDDKCGVLLNSIFNDMSYL